MGLFDDVIGDLNELLIHRCDLYYTDNTPVDDAGDRLRGTSLGEPSLKYSDVPCLIDMDAGQEVTETTAQRVNRPVTVHLSGNWFSSTQAEDAYEGWVVAWPAGSKQFFYVTDGDDGLELGIVITLKTVFRGQSPRE